MSDYRQEGTGKVITEQQLLKLAAESGLSVEEIVQGNNLKLITEDSGNTTGAATTTANVVPTNQIADTDSTLENGLSESQDPDPQNFTKRDSLVFNIQETEKQINNYIAKGGEVNASDAGVLQGYKDELSALDKAEVNNKILKSITPEVLKIYNKNKQYLKTTEIGTIDYDDEESISNFRNNSINEFVDSNETINKKIVPLAKKEIASDFSMYEQQAKVKYNLLDPTNISQKNIDLYTKDVSGYYNKLLNSKIKANPEFKSLINGFNNVIDEAAGASLKRFTKGKDWEAGLALADLAERSPYLSENIVTGLTKAYTGLRGVWNSFNKAGQYGGIQLTTEKVESLNKNKELAKKQNWTSETEGYWIKDDTNEKGSYIFKPKFASDLGFQDEGASTREQRKPVGAIEGTWGQFQSEADTWIKSRDEKNRKNLLEVQEEDFVLNAYDDDSFKKITEGEDVVQNTFALIGEQIPQMGLALVTLGASGGLQIGASIYAEGIDNRAREVFKLPEGAEVSIAQKREVMMDKKFMDNLAAKATGGGFLAGQLDRFGAGKVFKGFIKGGAKSILRGGMNNFLKRAGSRLVNNTIDASIESITEATQEVIEAGAAGSDIKPEQLFEAGGTGFLVSMVTGLGGSIKSQSIAEAKTVNRMVAGKLNPKSAEAFFNGKVKEIDKEIANERDPSKIEELEEKKQNALDARNANLKIPSNFSDVSKEKIFDLVIEKQNIEKEIKNKDPELVKEQSERIKEINEDLSKVSLAESMTQKAIKAGKNVIGGFTQTNVAGAEKMLADEGQAPLNKNAEGFFKEDGSFVLVMDRISDKGVFNTAAHEILHKILYNTLVQESIVFKDGKKGKGVIKGLRSALENELNKLDPSIIKDEQFQKRLELYKGQPESVQAEEVLTLFADAIAYGEISYSDSLGTKLKDVIRRLLQNLGIKDIEFNTGEDVYNFLKDYNSGIKTGKLGRAFTKASKEGIKVGESIAKADDDFVFERVKESSSLSKFNQQLEQLETEYDDGEIDFDVYEQQKANLESKIERAEKAETVVATKGPKKDIEVFHGGAVKTVNDIDGNIYFSESKEQAEEYAKGSNGKVQSFKINEDEIATEAQVFDVIRELNIQPRIEGWTVDDSRLYELIDARFENAFTKEDLSKLNEALAEKGIKATRFTDTDLRTSKDTENIVVFDKSAVSQKPKAVAKPKLTKENNQALKESTAKSKKELDDIGNNPDGFNKNNPKIYTILKGLIKSKSLVFKTKKGNIVNLNSLPGFDTNSMVSETIANMLPYIAKFNPKQNDSLFGYLMAQLNNRMKGALNTGKVTDSAFDVDVSEAKGITASEPTAPAAPEKTKYKNLVQQKVLSTDGLKTVRDKVISSVRVLKSKFDASVTKNVSVPPIIAEIKKDIGKQADIVLKKEMGGIKNNELQNYLKTNKKAILENMTTFYLTKAFPEAIQKSVGGKYLLDKDGKRVINTFGDATFVPNFVNSDIWKGADIDREKTSTEAKGKTSGNEIIRRVPNISQAISDELFLSSIIGPDGKPIRGRKESLAKAMGEEIAFDIINQDLKTDGPISEALKNNQEALGVVITENFEENMSRQIERGNIKFSISKDINEGVSILLENSMDQSSTAYNSWYSALNPETKDFWDEEFLPMFSKMDNATRRHFVKNGEELSKTFPNLKNGIEEYNKAFLGSSNPKSNPELAAEQLVSFQDGLSEIIGNTLSKIKGFKVYGKSTRIGDLSDKAKNNLTKSPSKESKALKKAREAAEFSIDKSILYKSGKEVNRINNFITNSIDGTPAEIATAFEKTLGKETREAKEANALIFEYVNLAALEYVINSKDVNKAFSGYLRWLETNNNNSTGLKALAFVGGFEIVKNQAVYLNSKGKKYYSRGGLKVLENFDNGKGLKVNKKHTNWKEAESFLNKEGFLKNTTGLQRNKMIASALEIMGEHQQSMGETGIRLSIALAETLQSIENGVSVEVAKENYNIKTKQIYSNFGLIFNSRFIGSIQNKALGLTSTLKKARIFAVDKKISNNFFTIEGNRLTEEGKNELNEVVKNIVKAKETASLNDKVKKEKPSSTKQSLTKEFNSIIERNKGVAADVTYSKIVAKRMGAGIGKYKFYIPSSAEDFRLLTGYTFSGKGKQGTKDMAWFDKNLIRPYTEGIAAIDVAKQTTKNDFKTLNKAMPNIAKTIGDLIPTKDYTNDQAVRVYLWNKAGYTVPGLNEKEVGALVAYVAGNPELALYTESLLAISKSNEWLKPSEHWDVGTILSDINNLTEKGGRKAYLAEWIENVDEIFSDENLNKIKALYGERHVTALKDSLYRMKNGTNRPSGTNAQVNRWNNWLNNSIGSIMFFNRRSALLQLLSTSNFLNWSDNNPVKAATAFANQKQYWKDFSTLFNSDKLKQRRGGLRADVNEAEIANEAANSKNKATAALSWLLKKGFTPTQIADSFAISSGGATFYRNRINTYLNQKDAEGNNLYTEKQAEDKAFLDFIEVSDQSQQSSDPSLVSMEQASVLGRLVLAFQNTTQQYSRIMKRSGLDIIKRRQMPGTTSMLQSDFSNFSKIMYYGAIQNLIFNGLSAAIFALIPGFGEEEEEIDKSTAEKLKRITNGSIDSILKGTGVRGAVIAQIKNTIIEYFKQKDKGFKGDQAYTVLQVANLSPPIGSKLKKIYSALRGEQYSGELMKQRGFDLTANGRLNLSPTYAVLGSLAAGAANIPLDRMYAEIQSVSEMLDNRNTIYQRLALSLGFRTWDVNAKNEEDDLIKAQLKETKKTKQKEKAKAERVETAKQKVIDRRKAYESLTEGQKQYILSLGKNARKKALDKQAKRLKEK